jgi:hypothetical protein
MKNYRIGTVENLQEGETIVVSARKVSGGKIQVMIGEIVRNPNLGESRPNVLGILNASDERFEEQKQKPRYAFVTVEADSFLEATGIDLLKAIDENQGVIGVINPELSLGDGISVRMRLEVRENLSGNYSPESWEMKNSRKAAKQIKTKQGQVYFTKDGQLIFTDVTVQVEGKVNHIFQNAPARCFEYELEALGIELTDEMAPKILTSTEAAKTQA